jgi:nucleoside-diphosphate-sugar epimerase
MSNVITDQDLILVTGASGFLATHVVKQLLEQGYRVRGTVRSVKDQKKCEPLRKLAVSPKHDLELVEADLLDEKSWLDAVKNCTYIIHTASPVPKKVPKDENEVIKPAVSGVLNVFRAAVQEGVKIKRVVLTSSMAAIAGDEFITDKVYSESDFSNASISQPYTKSKILSEKAAWDFVDERKKANQSCFELVVLNPGYIVGNLVDFFLYMQFIYYH